MEEAEAQNAIDNDLKLRINQLESDNKKLKGEFDNQRAKLKDLFLQKEGELERKTKENLKLCDEINVLKVELDETKSQLVVAGFTLESNVSTEKRKAREEIESLQQLVHETVEESSTCKSIYDMQLKKLYEVIQQYECEIRELKSEKTQSPHHVVQEQTSMAPSVMLSAVTKTLARKLGADTFTSQDNLEDSMRKVDDNHAQEDVEVLRSLVVPLEEEIKALKDKLRATDELLQKCQKCKHLESELQVDSSNDSRQSSTTTSALYETKNDLHSPSIPCDMCSNYEAELVKEQKKSEDLKLKIVSAEKASERHREELLKEIGFRKEIEEKWNEKKEQHKQEVAELTTRTDCAEQDLKELQQVFKQTCAEVNQHLLTLTHEREKVYHELIQLQKENDNLVGKYSIHSQQLQSEMINLPDTVEELQEIILKMHQDLIIAKIGKETAEEKVNTLESDNVLLKAHVASAEGVRDDLELSLTTECNNLKFQSQQLDMEKQSHGQTGERLKEMEKRHRDALKQIEELHKLKKQIEVQNNELRSRVGSLQQELDNSEQVQKDFVKLSQSLQVQLEKIRDSDTQVRWQHEEDIDSCPTCRTTFVVTKRKKQHCKHCGQVFCVTCLTHSVTSGPNQRLSKVCDVCHTLLVRSSAPYFSTEVPHSPD